MSMTHYQVDDVWIKAYTVKTYTPGTLKVYASRQRCYDLALEYVDLRYPGYCKKSPSKGIIVSKHAKLGTRELVRLIEEQRQENIRRAERHDLAKLKLLAKPEPASIKEVPPTGKVIRVATSVTKQTHGHYGFQERKRDNNKITLAILLTIFWPIGILWVTLYVLFWLISRVLCTPTERGS